MWSGFALVFFYVLCNDIVVVVWCISIISHRPHNEFCRKCVMKNGYMCNSDFSKFYHQNDHKKGCENCTKTAAFTGICLTFCHKTWSIFSETWIIMGNSTVTSVYQQSQGGTMSYNDQIFLIRQKQLYWHTEIICLENCVKEA